MDTSHLLAFTTVSETGSFSQAAQRLHLTQPAISKRIAGLEEQLEVRLFDRIGRRVSLTEAGSLLLPRARKILRDLDDTRVSIRNLSDSISGRLSLASSHHIGLHRLPPVLKSFTGRYPQVDIDISFLDSEQAYSSVLHGEIELAVVTLAPHEVSGILRHPVWQDPLCIMTSSDHPLAMARRTGLADLLAYPVILPAGNTFTRQLVEQVFRDHRLELSVGMSTNYLETIKMMVSVGMAWSVLPATMLDQHLHVLPVPEISLRRELGYIRHKDHTLSNAALAFIRLLEQQARAD